MLPAVNHPGWIQLITGKKQVQSSKATFNMLIHSNQMSYERDQSPANVQDLIDKSHSFLTKYESLFTGEIARIFE
ncbi:MAG: hypothetical protein ABSB60_14110 [Terracidiphilus sp.]|jgi:hypothetical protein